MEDAPHAVHLFPYRPKPKLAAIESQIRTVQDAMRTVETSVAILRQQQMRLRVLIDQAAKS